jgi:xylan 1,4-beta-xylosidase
MFLIILALSSCFLMYTTDTVQAGEKKQFTNPILAGFYPDPSICKVGSNYYMVNSTFSYFPGITVFHSRDLVQWKLIGHVLNRVEQLNLDGQGVSRGIFAPAIRYHKGIFYVTCTLVDIGGNFVATAKDPAGPWSNPVWLPEINGIDPSLFFDEDGKAFILYNSIAPGNKPLYEGHRTIRMYEFDIDSLKVKGEERLLINGGVDLSKKPIWIEAPHIIRKDGLYYLIAAEGGTADQHSEVVFNSPSVFGPYTPYKNNPILTQRHLNPSRKNPITCAGHADFVQTDSGEWWAVFLASRPYPPYREGFVNTGRETFLAPVKWIDGWPVINPDFEEVQYYYSHPLPLTKDPETVPYSGNFTINDDFNLRTPHDNWYDLKTRKGYLAMRLRPEACDGSANPSFLGRRQQHIKGSVSASLELSPKSENEKAGLLAFQNEKYFYFLCKSIEGDVSVVQLFKSCPEKDAKKPMELVSMVKLMGEEKDKDIQLRIESDGGRYAFFYKVNSSVWNLVKDNVDGTFLSTRVAGGFVGAVYALYATSSGLPSGGTAFINWFEYSGNDDVYK